MVEAPGRVHERSRDVIALEEWELLQNPLGCLAPGKHAEDVLNADSHSANAGSSPALIGVDCDPVE